MPISLYSQTGRLRASLMDGMDRRTVTDLAGAGDVLTVCECGDVAPHPTAEHAGQCRHRVMSVHFGPRGPRVDHGPAFRE